jgi:magnesium chelatase family protein
LESGYVAIARAARHATYPARFQLIAAMNPCPCGHLGDPSGKCRCTPDQIARYRGKISGPLLDRIDLKIEVPRPRESELTDKNGGESSVGVRERVRAARARQLARQAKPNAWLLPRETAQHCTVDAEAESLLKQAIARLTLSARGYHRLLRVARSIADLEARDQIASAHVAEAIQYRRMDASF